MATTEDEQPARRHHIPRHLEGYILAFCPFLSPYRGRARGAERSREEQRGAAAAEASSQADAASHLDRRAASHSPGSGDILNTTSHRKLIESTL